MNVTSDHKIYKPIAGGKSPDLGNPSKQGRRGETGKTAPDQVSLDSYYIQEEV